MTKRMRRITHQLSRAGKLGAVITGGSRNHGGSPHGTGARTRLLVLLLAVLATAAISSGRPIPTVEAVDASVAGSLQLDGVNDYVSVSPASELSLTPGGELTIEAWVRRTSGTRCEAIVSKGPTWWLGFCSAGLRYDSASVASTGATAVPANIWTHVAVVWRSGIERKLYINGELDLTAAAGPAPATNNIAVRVGANDPAFLPDYFAGNIGEVRLWNVARNQNEIRRNMHVAIEEELPGLVANWHFDGDLVDNIGGHNGSAVNNTQANMVAGRPSPVEYVAAATDAQFADLDVATAGAGYADFPDIGRTLIIGGFNGITSLGSIYSVDPASGASTQLPNLPSSATRYRPAAAYSPVDQRVYLFGGSTSTSSGYNNTIYKIDSAGVATNITPVVLNAGIRSMAAVYHPGVQRIYLLGGEASGGALSNVVRVFDPAGSGSVNNASFFLPEATAGMAAAYSPVTGKIYYFGGRILGGQTNSVYEVTVNPDGLTGSADLIFETVLPRNLEGLRAVEDPETHLIYLLGGENTFQQSTCITPSATAVGARQPSCANNVLAFDPVTRQLWETPLQFDERASTCADPDNPPANPPATMTCTVFAIRGYPAVTYDPVMRHALLIGGRAPAPTPVPKRDIWRIPLGDGPAVPLGRWDFPAPVTGWVTSIDGEGGYVAIGTVGNGAWIYHDTGTVQHALGTVNDVRYEPVQNEVWFATNTLGAKRDGPIGAGIDDTFTPPGYSRILSILSDSTSDFYLSQRGLFGTEGGLKRLTSCGGFFGCLWLTSLAGRDVRAIAYRDPPLATPTGAGVEVWTLADDHLWDPFGPSSSEVDGGSPCGLEFSLATRDGDLAFGPRGDWWVVSPGTTEFGGEGICRIPGAANPCAMPPCGQVGQPIELSEIGSLATAVDADSDGRIWVSVRSGGATSGGLAIFEEDVTIDATRSREINWLHGPVGSRQHISFPGVSIWDSGFEAVGAAEERVWAGKADGRLVTLARRWQQVDDANSSESKNFEGVWTVRGRAFVATVTTLEILAPDGKTWESRSIPGVKDVMADSRGRIWVAAADGVRLYTQTGWDMLPDVAGDRPLGPVYALAEDREGGIWIGGEDGLTLFDRDHSAFGRDHFAYTLTDLNTDMPLARVNTLLVDRDNRLWAGTWGGVAVLDGADWTLYTTANGLPDNAVEDLAELGDGRIALTTGIIDPEVTVYNGTSFVLQTLPAADSDLPLTVDQEGRLWAGRFLLTGNTWRLFSEVNSGLRDFRVVDNAADGADRVWFAHRLGGGISVRGTFLPPLENVIPTLTPITRQGSSGDEITILGSGFGTDRANVEVTVGGDHAQVQSATNSTLEVVIGDQAMSGDIVVSVGGGPRTRAPLAGGVARPVFCAEPVISGYSPNDASDGTEVVVAGSNFDRSAMITLGDGASQRPFNQTPNVLRVLVSSESGSGQVSVDNNATNCPVSPATTSGVPFQRYQINMDSFILNQGINRAHLVDRRQTIFSASLTSVPAQRGLNPMQISTVELTFRQVGGPLEETVSVEYTEAVPINAEATAIVDLANTLDVKFYPVIDQLLRSDGEIDVVVTLKNRGHTLAQTSRREHIFRDRPLKVLLVPIMRNDYRNYTGLVERMKSDVNPTLEEARYRIFPSGGIEFVWSDMVFTVDDVLYTTEWNIEIDDVFELYEASHELDEARSRYNSYLAPGEAPVLVTFGILDAYNFDGVGGPDIIDPDSKATGYGFWPDASEWINLLAATVDFVCDVVSAVFTLGLADECELDIPIYVAWGQHDGGSALFAHEIGHTMSLVGNDAANGCTACTHSVTDEMIDDDCNDPAQYRQRLTLYRAAGVREPIVNPLKPGIRQFLPQLSGNQNTLRAQAIMSYACNKQDGNVYFEPADFQDIFDELEGSIFCGSCRRAGRARLTQDVPLPRLYVSGVVNRIAPSGTITQVQPLEQTPRLSPDFTGDFALVQLDGSGNELARRGLFPMFRTYHRHGVPGGPTNPDDGFFAATLERQPGVARLELRFGNTVLDTFEPGPATPTVSITSPGAGCCTTVVPVDWTASDADVDTLNVDVDYSADGGATWSPVQGCEVDAGPQPEPPTICYTDSVQIPVDELPGSNNARIRVTASDGLHEQSAISGAFVVPQRPPLPYIGAPDDGARPLEGETALLSGGATDNIDGTVAEVNLSWSSDRDGALGAGSQLPARLSVGTHIITLHAENSVGLSADETITLTVIGDHDADGIADEDELSDGLSPLTSMDALSDEDGDGAFLIQERERGLNPTNPDTDGDGRSDGDEILQTTDPVNADPPPDPDELLVYPQQLTFGADLSRDALVFPQHKLTLFSRETVDWSVSPDVPWLNVTRASGTTLDTIRAIVDASQLTDGTHNGMLTFTSVDLGQMVQVPVTVNISNTDSLFDMDDDGWLDAGDVQGVAGRYGAVSGDAAYQRSRDVDRDGAIDIQDVVRMTQRWAVSGNCCNPSDPPAAPAALLVSAPSTVAAGDTFTVTVSVSNATDLAAFELSTVYNPALVAPLSASLGSFLSGMGRTPSPLGPVVDYLNGRGTYGAASTGGSDGPDGAGTIATFTVKALAAGTAQLDFQAALLADPAGNSQAPTIQDVSITITPRPDLVVEQLQVVPASGVEDQNVNLTATVRNVGSDCLSPCNFYIDVYKDSITQPVTTGDFYCQISGLTAGATANCGGILTYADAGTYTLWAAVDYDQIIAESNETNNWLGPQSLVILADTDGDTWPNSTDNCPNAPNPGQENADGDARGDACDGCPSTVTAWVTPLGDDDCDAFPSSAYDPVTKRAAESFMGTLPNSACAANTFPNNEDPDPWPMDNNDDRKAALSDILAYIPVFGTNAPPPPSAYNPRFDLNADNKIGLSDILMFIPFFNQTCTP